jgi:hypothetical protein
MPDGIAFVVSHHPERKSIFLCRAGLGNQAADEVTAANVMQEIGERMISERKIPEVRQLGVQAVRKRLFSSKRISLNESFEESSPELLSECA